MANFDPSKPTVVITHGWQPGNQNPDWVAEMSGQIKGAVTSPSGVNVIQAYWDDAKTLLASADALQSATAQVNIQGQLLGEALAALAGSFEGGIQFIGHSLGTHVNAYAANFLTDGGTPVEQFTILDRPFGQGLPVDSIYNRVGGDVDQVLFRTLLPEGLVKWVDNYFGDGAFAPPSTGASFAPFVSALNRLYPGADHSEVHEEYAASIGSNGGCTPNGGFACSIASGNQIRDTNWSPGISDIPYTNNVTNLSTTEWLTFNCLSNTAGTGIDCFEGSPAYLWNDNFTFNSNAEFLSFDFRWSNLGDGDWMTVHFDDTLLFSYTGTAFTGSEFRNSGPLAIGNLAGRSGQLLFSLNSVGQSNAAFSIANLAVLSNKSAVPEPSVWIMMVLGFGLIAGQLRRRGRSNIETNLGVGKA